MKSIFLVRTNNYVFTIFQFYRPIEDTGHGTESNLVTLNKVLY